MISRVLAAPSHTHLVSPHCPSPPHTTAQDLPGRGHLRAPGARSHRVWDTQQQQQQPPLHHHPVLLLLLDPTATTNHAFARGHQHGLSAPLQVLVQGGKEAPAVEPEAGRKRVLQGQQLCLDGAGQQRWYVHQEGKRKEGLRKKRRGKDRGFGCGAPAMVCALVVSAGFCMDARAQW